MPLRPIRRALLSVHDKTGLVGLAQQLARRNVELLSTGGTARAIGSRTTGASPARRAAIRAGPSSGCSEQTA